MASRSARPLIAPLCDEFVERGETPTLDKVAKALLNRYQRRASRETIASEVRLWLSIKRDPIKGAALSQSALEVAELFERARQAELARLTEHQALKNAEIVKSITALRKLASIGRSRESSVLEERLNLIGLRIDMLLESLQKGDG